MVNTVYTVRMWDSADYTLLFECQMLQAADIPSVGPLAECVSETSDTLETYIVTRVEEYTATATVDCYARNLGYIHEGVTTCRH